MTDPSPPLFFQPFKEGIYGDGPSGASPHPNRKRAAPTVFLLFLFTVLILHPIPLLAKASPSCGNKASPRDGFLVTDPKGRILSKQNETKAYVPASILKILTGLGAIRTLGPEYRFRTEFYMDMEENLIIKGYGDPLLVSEVWAEIADELSRRISSFHDLVLDTTYFSASLTIPGQGNSTNPYDAPVSALCANFNTVFFHTDQQGRIASSEPQTPMIPYVREKILALGVKKGRYTFAHDPKEAARYAGELVGHFLREKGVQGRGAVRLSPVRPGDRLIYAFSSPFTLPEAVQRMLEFSNNVIANQIFISLGAACYGPPGTLEKGVQAIRRFAQGDVHLHGIHVVEGSGLSRENRISPLDMAAILECFRPYRHLLRQEGRIFFKTGTLTGVRNQAGYFEGKAGGYYPFVIFLNHSTGAMETLLKCLGSLVPPPDL